MESVTTPGQPARGPKPVRPTRTPPALPACEEYRLTRAREPVPRPSSSPGNWLARQLMLRARAGLVLAAYALGFALIYIGVFEIRYDGAVPSAVGRLALALLPLVLSVKLLAVVAMSCHRGWWRYATFADLVNLVQATTIGSVALGLVLCLLARPLPCRSRSFDGLGRRVAGRLRQPGRDPARARGRPRLVSAQGPAAAPSARRRRRRGGRSPRAEDPRHLTAGDAGLSASSTKIGRLTDESWPACPSWAPRPTSSASPSGTRSRPCWSPARSCRRRRFAPWSASARRPASRYRWCPGSMPCSVAD